MISQEDRRIVARIAYEAEGIAVSSVKELAWEETEEYVQDETLARLDRVLSNNDPSVFGKVARSVAAALADAGLIVVEPDPEPMQIADADEPVPLPEPGKPTLGKAVIAVRGEIKNPPHDEPETRKGKK
jgi:hypothetical protein